MIMVTTDNIEGKRIVEVFGLVRRNTVRARAVSRDIVAGLRTIIGGEITEYSRLLTESRDEAIERMLQAAEQSGANAVVGVRFVTSGIMGGASEILAYGTAVKIE